MNDKVQNHQEAKDDSNCLGRHRDPQQKKRSTDDETERESKIQLSEEGVSESKSYQKDDDIWGRRLNVVVVPGLEFGSVDTNHASYNSEYSDYGVKGSLENKEA